MDENVEPTQEINSHWYLPTAAILSLVMGVYVILLILGLFIRKWLMSRGLCNDCCSKPVSPNCSCMPSCIHACDFRMPTVDSCLDAVCPPKQRLNCVEFLICEWASFRFCQEGATYTCGSGEYSCTCEAPHCDSINCLCCEISFRNVSTP